MAEQGAFGGRDRQREYWRNRDLQPVVHNPLVEALSSALPGAPPRAATRRWALSARVAADVLRVCNGSELSLYILLVTMYKSVAARYAGDGAVTVLAPYYGAGDGACDGNLLMLQDVVHLAEDVRSNVLETRRTIVGAYSNPEITLAELHGPALAEAIVRNNPLCVLSNLHTRATRPPACPLELRFTRSGGEISCDVTYDAARLHAGLVAELCANLERFITAASADYTVALERVEWLQGERLARVSALSRGPVVAETEAGLHALFAAQARRSPDAVALIHGGRSVTYAELDAMAGAAAERLAGLGVEPGAVVALRLRSAVDMLAVSLAALELGAAFAPIGVDDPPSRVRRLLERCRPAVLVTSQEAAGLAAGVRTATASRLCEPGPASRAARPDRPHGAAYMIFTSGTSGEPKGVVVDHRGIVNAVAWKLREYAFAPAHRVLPLFGFEFDGFVLNAFAPLCAGATVVLLDDEDRRRPERIAACIGRELVTHLVAAPLLYDAVLGCVTGDGLRSLQQVTLAGEVANPRTLARSRDLAPHTRVANEYGPTENSVVATYQRQLDPTSAATIGRPIDNVDVFIVDPRDNLVPPGVVGELLLAGPGLARGYLAGDAGVDGGFREWQGRRVYATRDLGRWLPDGDIEFRGRHERHVKLRGHRVDLEEIRQTITRHDAVRDAAIVHVGDATDGMLCACVVIDSPAALADIEAALRDELPPHMLPNRVLALEALPLNAGGKLDLAALRARVRARGAAEARGAPSNEVERRLVAIWREVLETERVGVDDGFFALGGHSLRAVRLLTAIHAELAVELRLSQLFEANTIRRLAALLADHPREPAAGLAGAAADDATSPDAPLSSAQERMLALTQEHPVSYNLPVLFALDGALDLPRFRSALRAVIDRHDSLRASFHLIGDQWRQRFVDAPPLPIAERMLAGDEGVEAAIRSALAPFDLEAAPLLRVVLFRGPGRRAYLLFDFHHIVVDEVSLAIVFEELSAAYRGDLVGRAPSPSYAAHACSQQRRRATAGYQAQLRAVADRFRGLEIEPLRLPFDRPPPRRRNHSGGSLRRRLSDELVTAARDLCARAEATEFMLFMAVFSLFLHKYTHQSSMVIGAPVSLRSTAGTRDLVGLCLNTVPFVVAVSSHMTFLGHLRSVVAGVVADLGRSQVEFDDLVSALGSERKFGENPLFSVMLNVVDASATRLTLQDLEAECLPLHNGTAKFDLILEIDLAGRESSFSFEFSAERFHESTIRRLSDGLVTLLSAIVADPSAPLAALPVLSPAEREQLLEWGGVGNVGTYGEGSLVSRFERQVLSRPVEVALVFGEESVTYGELNARANRLARKLRALGCGEDDVVAVFCERSPAAIVGILAAQKAGAAHLPLDPFYPLPRTSKMLADSGARVLLADQDVRELSFRGPVVRTDADLSELSPENLDVARRPESLGYVLYTSGTTGGPKGAMVEQRNVVNLVERVTAELSIGPSDVWTLFHSLCFDVSVCEMFGALLHGGRLVIVPRAIAVDPDRILRLVERHRVTVLCQPPSAFYMLADAMTRAGRSTTLRYVILGGEAVKTENVKGWYERYGQTD